MALEPISNKRLFAKAPSQITRLSFLLIISIIMMAVDYRYKKLESVRFWLNTALYPVYFAAESPAKISNWLSSLFESKQQLQLANNHLKAENLHLKKDLQKTRYIQAQNERLQSMLRMSSQLSNDDAQIAEIMYIEQKNLRNELVINKGSTNGVYLGQPVLSTQGLIGQINHVSLKTSTVLLVTSPKHILPIQIGSASHRGTAQGTGPQSNLELKRMQSNADLKLGDPVGTSGIGGVFPPGYPVGIIDKITSDQQFIQVEIKSYVDTAQIREVLLIWPPHRVDEQNATD